MSQVKFGSILGVGGFGTVYDTGDSTAIKVLPIDPNDGISPSALNESNILSFCNHPNIVKCYNVQIGHMSSSEKVILTTLEKCDVDIESFYLKGGLDQLVSDILASSMAPPSSYLDSKEMRTASTLAPPATRVSSSATPLVSAAPVTLATPVVSATPVTLATVATAPTPTTRVSPPTLTPSPASTVLGASASTRVRTAAQRIASRIIYQHVYEMFSGLAYLHRHHIIHGDIKPKNILLHNGRIKIIDIGLAQYIFNAQPRRSLIQTAWLRAPEVILADRYYDERVDTWSMGVLLFNILFQHFISMGTDSYPPQILFDYIEVFGVPDTENWLKLVAGIPRYRVPLSPSMSMGVAGISSPATLPLLSSMPSMPSLMHSLATSTVLSAQEKDDMETMFLLSQLMTPADLKARVNARMFDKFQQFLSSFASTSSSSTAPATASSPLSSSSSTSATATTASSSSSSSAAATPPTPPPVRATTSSMTGISFPVYESPRREYAFRVWIQTHLTDKYEQAVHRFGQETIDDMISLIHSCLSLDPLKRVHSADVLRLPMFASLAPHSTTTTATTATAVDAKDVAAVNNVEKSVTSGVIAPTAAPAAKKRDESVDFMTGTVAVENKSTRRPIGPVRGTSMLSSSSSSLLADAKAQDRSSGNKSTNGAAPSAPAPAPVSSSLRRMMISFKQRQEILGFHDNTIVIANSLATRLHHPPISSDFVKRRDPRLLSVAILFLAIKFNECGLHPYKNIRAVIVDELGFSAHEFETIKEYENAICTELKFTILTDECRLALKPFINYF